MSHLLQMRGLKRFSKSLSIGSTLSHLLQMRGLKHLCSATITYRHWSHLLQMRGLKLLLLSIFCMLIGVASFTDAWIETPENTKGLGTLTSHLLQMRGLKL